ncbi:hypothetical protein [Deinococcus sp. QL22]|uniref:hypothetical protein n=1 Tax=Deinococcus sp. QL22 TaxID=2939437 RepID=UPI002017EA85|nr:hypothetical protein [Deinococcus sp. QL22]UQN10761.1 hypothetical protein M1R55_31510 [Deinococcus sp. QL22]UQN10807.1 hypothetical protein M1R55_31260 [Deinococcus sp. QL22]
MTTDSLFSHEPDAFPNAIVQAHLSELHCSILKYRQEVAETEELLRQSSLKLAASDTRLKRSATVLAHLHSETHNFRQD